MSAGLIFSSAIAFPSGVVPYVVERVSSDFATLNLILGIGSATRDNNVPSTVSRTTSTFKEGAIVYRSCYQSVTKPNARKLTVTAMTVVIL